MAKSGFIIIHHDLHDKPETIGIAQLAGIENIDACCGVLLRVWTWADRHGSKVEGTTDVMVPDVGLDGMDLVARVPGFAGAMEAKGWLRRDGGSLVFPRLAEYSGQTAKRRIEDAMRKRSGRSADTCGQSADKVRTGCGQSADGMRTKVRTEIGHSAPTPHHTTRVLSEPHNGAPDVPDGAFTKPGGNGHIAPGTLSDMPALVASFAEFVDRGGTTGSRSNLHSYIALAHESLRLGKLNPAGMFASKLKSWRRHVDRITNKDDETARVALKEFYGE